MTAASTKIVVRERGRVEIEASIWRRIASHPDLWALIEAGILGISRTGRTTVVLHASRFVGLATIGDIEVEVREKVPGALRALIAFATYGSFNVQAVTSPETEFGGLTSLLVGQFVRSVKSYVARGREFRYAAHPMVSSLIRGKLDVSKTIALRAKGMGHLIAFERTAIDYAIEKNAVLLRALREVEAIARVSPIADTDLSGARTLAMLFSDCRNTEVLFGARKTWTTRAEQLIKAQQRNDDRDLLALASVLLSHRGFENDLAHTGIAPRAWFLNLEDLFEAAVRRTFSKIVAPSVSVLNGKELRFPIFDTSEEAYRADPDIVINRDGFKSVIGDVKHKEWTGGTIQHDLYQLLVHAATYHAEKAFLVYPGNDFLKKKLGISSVGIEVEIFVVDVQRLDEHLTIVLRHLGVAVNGENVTGAEVDAATA